LDLLNNVIQHFQEVIFKKLTETYLTLSISDIAKAAKISSPQEAEKILFRMIENGEIKAVINQKNKMVSFIEDVQEFDSPETCLYLDNKISQSIELCNRLKTIDQDIGSSTIYIARLHGIREEMFSDFGQGGKGARGLGKMFEMFR